jgi:hypothetical protein
MKPTRLLLVVLALCLALLAGGCGCGDDDDDNDNDDHDDAVDDDASTDDDVDAPCGPGWDLMCWAFTAGGECLDSYPETDMDQCVEHCKQYDDAQASLNSAENEDTGETYGSYCVCCTTPMW